MRSSGKVPEDQKKRLDGLIRCREGQYSCFGTSKGLSAVMRI
jgi:hypothetical protein